MEAVFSSLVLRPRLVRAQKSSDRLRCHSLGALFKSETRSRLPKRKMLQESTTFKYCIFVSGQAGCLELLQHNSYLFSNEL